jgi:poly(3-hydroxybutyrate) depolymerase
MRFLGIDDYLTDLSVLIEDIGTPVNLVGVCQEGWLALIYAARFPGKVCKLVLAGAPIDVHAAPSALSMLADGSPLTLFHELVRLGDGLVPGRRVLKFWGPASITAEDVRQILETEEQAGSVAFRGLELAFQDWYAWTVDLPGPFFLETVEKLYRRNEVATGRFVALGRRINLTAISAPTFLLAARDDELVAPPQLFAAERLVGTPARRIQKTVAPCRHAGLFLSKGTLGEVWPRIARWIDEPVHSVGQRERAGHQNLSTDHV